MILLVTLDAYKKKEKEAISKLKTVYCTK
jgi:hypothetical protein